MTGSFYRTYEIQQLLKSAVGYEIGAVHASLIASAERLAISDQLCLLGTAHGLD